MIELLKKWWERAKSKYYFFSNDALRQNLLQALPFWVASAITGVMAVVFARLFAWAESLLVYGLGLHAWIIFIAAPLGFFASWFLVKKWAPAARGSGIPQVMAAIELANPRENARIDKLLSLRIILVKMGATLMMVLGGGAVGREGPTIQVAGSVFRFVNKHLPASWPKISKQNMIMTGAAAGLAAAFNTPLGGIVFAVEELTKTHFRRFRTAIFSAVIIAGLTAQGMLGPYLYLGYPDMNHMSGYIILVCVLVALVAGAGGSALARFIVKIFRWKKRFTTGQQLGYLFACAMLMAVLGYTLGSMAMGSGKEIMTHTLFTDAKTVPWYLPLVRFTGSIASFTVGGSGGVFAPGLAAGASIGSVMAGWFHFAGSNTNILIMAGMVAFLTGITRSPFTSAILVLEMTDRHNVIFQLMVSAMVASLVALVIDRRSLYDHLKEDYLEEAREASPAVAATVIVPETDKLRDE